MSLQLDEFDAPRDEYDRRNYRLMDWIIVALDPKRTKPLPPEWDDYVPYKEVAWLDANRQKSETMRKVDEDAEFRRRLPPVPDKLPTGRPRKDAKASEAFTERVNMILAERKIGPRYKDKIVSRQTACNALYDCGVRELSAVSSALDCSRRTASVYLTRARKKGRK